MLMQRNEFFTAREARGRRFHQTLAKQMLRLTWREANGDVYWRLVFDQPNRKPFARPLAHFKSSAATGEELLPPSRVSNIKKETIARP